MKKFLLYSFCLSLITCMVGCKDYLDQVPDDRLTMDLVFQRKVESERYLATGYNYLWDEQNQKSGYPWFGASDEGDVSWDRPGDGYNTHQMNIGNWSPVSNYFQKYTLLYEAIRHVTYFIQRIDENAEILSAPNGEALIKQYKAEARALRAYFYYSLIRQYGPVVIIYGDEVVDFDASIDVLQRPQNTYDECVEFITSELDMAMVDLPVWYDSGQMLGDQDYGRLTKSFCLALKSRVLLLAASPLFNGNREMASFKSSEGTSLINQVYDENKWKLAAEAAKAVIDLDRFSLYKEYKSNGELDPFLSYQNVLIQPWNSEIIYARINGDATARGFERDASPRFAGGWNGMGVTQQMVDAYYMANGERPVLGYQAGGQPIINSSSGYTEVGTASTASPDGYWKAGVSNMYVNREPRFYASIVFHKSIWINKVEGEKEVQLNFNGNSGKYNSFDYSKTGYLVRKNIHPQTYPSRSNFPRRPYVLFRLAEIYLNYIEALNEYDPGNADILHYLNLIRERAGIPLVAQNMSQADMRDLIRQERRIELAFESHRFFDTRRWKIAVQTDGGAYWGMNVDANEPNFYQRTRFETRVFRPQYYFFPIPQMEMDRNRSLVQNPGW